ncbi:histone acetyltransferase subunit NuA4-domain-containing protein [Phakopsora pachyrhizi]|uniref:Chromatin modification-related protein EAF6 n=1 Tax=Phakopsora pachyrhizi TaxID=170000 RepID=A0AAV0B250_PHAPC|nr:histone acetyltransferase subunit NuA4-domain-containing protein [Phakopsora pachyrhizi]
MNDEDFIDDVSNREESNINPSSTKATVTATATDARLNHTNHNQSIVADQSQQNSNSDLNSLAVDQDLIIKLEEAKRELALNLAKKKKLDKELAALETTLYAHETAYLTDPSANSFGNIVKGYEAYVKAPPSTNLSTGDYHHSTRRKRTYYPNYGNSSNNSSSNFGSNTQTELVGNAERIFSKSSGSYTRALEARSREHESNVTSEQESVVPASLHQQSDHRKKSLV